MSSTGHFHNTCLGWMIFPFSGVSLFRMKLSVIIPAFNEEEKLPQTLKASYQWLTEHLAGDFEIIVVDDGSHDKTCVEVQMLFKDMPELKLSRQPINLGKGAAVRRGMLEATGDIRLFMDADHSTRIDEIHKILNGMEQGADLVIASRRHKESHILSRQSYPREHMGRFFNFLARTLVKVSMLDTQCGFKAFTAKAAQAIFTRQQLDGFSFDVEVLVLAERLSLNIVEIPVSWTNEPNSRVHVLRDSWKMAFDLMRLRQMYVHR